MYSLTSSTGDRSRLDRPPELRHNQRSWQSPPSCKARQWLPTLSSAGAGKELSLTVTAPSALSILVINIRMKVHFQNYIWSINQSWTLMVKKYKKNPAHLLSCTQLHSDFSAPGSDLMMENDFQAFPTESLTSGMWPLGKPLSACHHLHVGIAQIAFTPPPALTRALWGTFFRPNLSDFVKSPFWGYVSATKNPGKP